jgi:ketosteroid isomerase-like protein
MSEQAELLRDIYGRRTIEEFAAELHPDVELNQGQMIPDTGEYRGRDEFVLGVRRWLEEWDTFRFTPEEVVDAGQRVFMRLRLWGRASRSGLVAEQAAFHVWTFRDGMPWRCEVYFEEEQARAAAGMLDC